jgi:hypothetical protein
MELDSSILPGRLVVKFCTPFNGIERRSEEKFKPLEDKLLRLRREYLADLDFSSVSPVKVNAA